MKRGKSGPVHRWCQPMRAIPHSSDKSWALRGEENPDFSQKKTALNLYCAVSMLKPRVLKGVLINSLWILVFIKAVNWHSLILCTPLLHRNFLKSIKSSWRKVWYESWFWKQGNYNWSILAILCLLLQVIQKVLSSMKQLTSVLCKPSMLNTFFV